MTVELKHEDFLRIVDLMQSHADFALARSRRLLVEAALAGSPRADTILAGLDLDGTPRTAAVAVVRYLANFGQVAYGKEALGVFLNYLQDTVGQEQADVIAGLFAAYPLKDVAAIRQRPLMDWHGRDSSVDVREKIIGENTLRHVRMLEQALAAARAVVRIGLPNGCGSGFMIAPDLLMTNNHVIASRDEAARAEFTFNYQLDRTGKACEVTTVGARYDGAFHTNAELDFTVLQLCEAPDIGQPLKLRPALVRRDERVAIIQHPGGHFKQISMQNNFVAYADRRVVQYTTTTLHGSSGSPVFDDDFNVVAIHREGGELREPGSDRLVLRNGATSMCAVLGDLEMYATAIHSRIERVG
jgi:V8-like Glu-specific endopeptidase